MKQANNSPLQEGDPRRTSYDLADFESFRSAGRFYLSRNPNPKEWRTTVILGTGRSGTTMTAGVLMLLGVEFGIEPTSASETGKFPVAFRTSTDRDFTGAACTSGATFPV